MTILPEQPPPRRSPFGSGRRGLFVAVAAALVAGVIAAVVVVATSGGSGSAPGPVASRSPVWPPHAWRAALDAVSQPAPVGGRFVVYAAARGTLETVGLDARSGRVVWTLAASPSVVAPGTAAKLTVVGGRVVYLAAGGGQVATVASADAATGAVVWRSPPGLFSDWPSVCPDNVTAICVSGRLQDGSAAGVLRFDVATGRSLPSSQVGPDARQLAPDLFDIGQRRPEVIAATTGSTMAWQQPLRRIFTLRGSSTDYGWNFDRIPRLGIFVGSVGTPPLVQTSTRYAVDLSKAMTAGFRMGTGRVVWRDSGSQYVCGYLSCPGAINPAYSSVADARAGGPTVGLRLRARGVLSGSPTAIGATASPDARGRLEGFDPATGHRTWSFDFGRDVGLLTQTRLPPVTSARAIVLRTPSGRAVEVDVVSGAKRAVTAGMLAWCSKVVSYHMTVPYQAGGHSLHEYVGQYALTPCSPTGRPTAAPSRGTAAMNGLVAQTQGEMAWMERGAVVAVPQ